MKKKVLIIDDDIDIVDSITMVLEANDFEVKSYNDMEDVIDRVKSESPDVLILDVMFPENPSGGFEMARLIKQDVALKDLPIIILSAVNEKFKLGFSNNNTANDFMPVNEFLEKPVNIDTLLQKVKQFT